MRRVHSMTLKILHQLDDTAEQKYIDQLKNIDEKLQEELLLDVDKIVCRCFTGTVLSDHGVPKSFIEMYLFLLKNLMYIGGPTEASRLCDQWMDEDHWAHSQVVDVTEVDHLETHLKSINEGSNCCKCKYCVANSSADDSDLSDN